MMSQFSRIYIWLPNIFEYKGGIQTYCAFFLQAIQNCYPQAEYHIFLKNDRQQDSHFSSAQLTTFHCFGAWPMALRTLAFAAYLFLYVIIRRPDLIIIGHLNFSPIAYWLKFLFGVRYILLTYGLEAWDINSSTITKALMSADKTLSISHYTADRLIKEQNLNLSNVAILPCQFLPGQFCVAPKPPHLLKKYQLRPEQPVILTVARLAEVEQYKGYDQILQALPLIRQVFPDIHYCLVGKGNDQARIENLIDDLQLQDCVTLTGFVPDEELCDYYNLCDVFAMPSKREGFGIVYLEAMACGKPCLGGNQDGTLDALCHGELGALVNPDDIEEITNTLISILQKTYPNSILYQPEQLRQAVIDRFGFNVFQQRLQDYLEPFLTDSESHPF